MQRFVGLALVAALPLGAGVASAAPERSVAQEREAAQTAPPDEPVGREPTAAEISGKAPLPGPNPYLATLPAGARPDYDYWQQLVESRSDRRKTGGGDPTRFAAADPAVTVTEQEPEGLAGRNDTLANAQPLGEIGTEEGLSPDGRVLGSLAEIPVEPEPADPSEEDDGSIEQAHPIGLSTDAPALQVEGVIGDGPDGGGGDVKGDLDFYATGDLEPGQRLVVRLDTPATGSELDPYAAVYDPAGNLRVIAGSDDERNVLFDFDVEDPGPHYVVIVSANVLLPEGFGALSDTTDEASEGPYDLTLLLDPLEDADVFALDLVAGDVLGATVDGSAGALTVLDAEGTTVMGVGFDISGVYPASTTLIGGGNVAAEHVVAETGRHYVAVHPELGSSGRYEMDLRVQRPPLESAGPDARQVLFLDFDGAQLNTNVFGGPGVRTLSPLPAFLGGWGLGTADEDAVIDAIADVVEEHLNADLQSVSPGAAVEVRTSRDDPDPWGQPDVSRVIVGGTVDELGIPTIGIAQSIDPGNFDREETAVVLLDLLSDPAGSPDSLNSLAGPDTDMVELVGRGVGNVVAHEAGHFFGNWHTDPFNDTPNLQDAGAGDVGAIAGSGEDGVFGTDDDVEVRFGRDEMAGEGLYGLEDTRARPAYGVSGRPLP